MFPHVSAVYLNEEGNSVSSHMLLLTSGTEQNQLDVQVEEGTKKVKIVYTYPALMQNKIVIERACDLDENSAKVKAFQNMFASQTKKNKGKAMQANVVISTPFECESEPEYLEINYFNKDPAVGSQHILYILMVDFVAKKQYKAKKRISEGRFFI